MASSGPGDGELDKMIEQQRQLLQNIERLEKEAPGKQSTLRRMAKSMQRNRSGAAAMLMAATCAVMSLNMLRHKKDYEAKAEEIEEALSVAQAQEARALKDAEELRGSLDALKMNVLKEIRAGGWGMTARIESLCGKDPSGPGAGAAGPAVDSEKDLAPKIQPKMI